MVVLAKTVETSDSDGLPILVEGCSEKSMSSDVVTTLNTTNKTVTLKGDITEFHCEGCELTSLDVQSLINLQKLFCDNNKISNLYVKGLNELKTLYCFQNNLTNIEFSNDNFPNLNKIDCYNNKLPKDFFSNLLDFLPDRKDSDSGKCVLL